MRGYTSSTGSSMGQWVARSPDGNPQGSAPQARVPVSGEGGSSFVFGGGGVSRPTYNSRSGSATSSELSEYGFKMDEVRHRGTTGGADAIPSNCFRSKHFRQGASGSDGGLQSYKAVTFLFMLLIGLVLVAFCYAGRLPSKIQNPLDRGFAPEERRIDYGRGLRPSWEP